jgi:cell division protein FtsI/penicillin-binding protein 2
MFQRGAHRRDSASVAETRMRFVQAVFVLLFAAIVLRLAYLQIAQYGFYALYASDQHVLASKLMPTRGQIFVRDTTDESLHPLAINRLSWQIYAVPKEMEDPIDAAHKLAEATGQVDAEVVAKLSKENDPYELIVKDADADMVEKVKALGLDGIGYVQSTTRLYPERGMGGQLLGFVAKDEQGFNVGRYGVEGSFNDLLAGTPGSLEAEKDAGGRRLAIGQTNIVEARNGSDVVLTIDRAIQFKACDVIRRATIQHNAPDGSIVVMDPHTGAVLAMCSWPDFDSAEYGKVSNLSILNNPVTLGAYEAGSVFKAFTMAAGLDAQKINPKTTYVDTGLEEIDDMKIKNSDGQAHGVQTMTAVLEQSLNTGTIFVQRQLGKDKFREYVEAFGFGRKTDIGLTPEAKGDTSSLTKKGAVFAATASYGHGITVTPLQIVAGYAALANGGKLFRPYIVDEIIHPDGTREKTKPELMGTPISSRASRLITGMLINVVENGHGKQAGVPGYWVAGKTGTALVPREDGPGYYQDVTIGTFAGYAPANDPKFAMIVRIDRPEGVQFAESTAAPVFGEMAKFLMTHMEVPKER